MRKNKKIIQGILDAENLKAEYYSTLVQFVFLLFILFVYFVSPKGFTQAQFEPVLIAFWVYLPVLCTRWILLKTRLYREWCAYLFIVIDVLVLSSLIWSFHIQYAAPLTLSLRSPTYLYFFVFLALRALSFRLSHVLVYVLSFTGCWSLMVYLAYHSSDLRLTRSFREILESNTFILGVEIDKMLAVFLAAGIIAFSIHRKRLMLNQLAQLFVREGAMKTLIGQANLHSFNLLEDELVPGQVKRKVGATLMVDLRGFSVLSYTISAEQLLLLLNEYQQIVVRRVIECGGVVDKYLGDGILAHFGVARELPSFCASAIRAAELIEGDLIDWKNRLRETGLTVGFGVGVSHGEVVFGVIGHPEKMEITVLGDSVNLAAKLEKHTKKRSCHVLVDKTTFEQASRDGYTPLRPVAVFDDEDISGIPTTKNLITFSLSVTSAET